MEFSNDLFKIFIPGWVLIVMGFSMGLYITYASIPSIVAVARAKGFYDMPNGRTSHTLATPYLGGVAVFTGLILSTVVIAGAGFEHDLMYIIAGLVILLFIGLKDDMLMINPLKKLTGQLIASGIIIAFGNIRIDDFHGWLGINEIPFLSSILFTIFVFIVIINGVNLIDGIDGLASGVGILVSIALGIWFLLAGFIHYSVMSFALSGSLIAFFYFNVLSKKNKIFLGDAGSLMVGLTLSVLVIRFLNYQTISLKYNVNSAPAIAFGLLIIPFYDTLRVFTLRIFQGRSPFSADRQHIHHILIDLGNTHFLSTLILLFVNLFFIVFSFSLQYLRITSLIVLQLIIATFLSLIASYLLRRKRRLKFLDTSQHGGKQVSIVKSSDQKLGNKDKTVSKRLRKIQFLNLLDV